MLNFESKDVIKVLDALKATLFKRYMMYTILMIDTYVPSGKMLLLVLDPRNATASRPRIELYDNCSSYLGNVVGSCRSEGHRFSAVPSKDIL